jgi:predicted GNAT family N-acyltransferase
MNVGTSDAPPAVSGTFRVVTGAWPEYEPALRHVRHAVFVVEQAVPANLEWDEHDAMSLHALAVDVHAAPIGCARLLPDARIGRVAVLAAWRRRGVGSTLVRALIDAARERGGRFVVLNAQVQAMPFYARHGFVGEGDEFDEAGIAHRAMRLVL